jgi:hypothetical protein
VVGRADGDHIDVFALEQLAVVGVGFGRSLAQIRFVLRRFGSLLVDVANGDDLAQLAGLRGDRAAAAANSDRSDPQPVGFLVGGGDRPRRRN